MKHIVWYSGGVGSFVAAEMVLKEFGKENTIILFSDVKMEHYDLYRFNIDVQNYLKKEIHVITQGMTPWEAQEKAKYQTNTRIDPCSRILKREFMDSWIKNNFKPEECISYIGIDASEIHRIEKLAPEKLPYIFKAPMAEKGIWLSRDKKIKYCIDRGIKPPQLYLDGFPHNNCQGACPKAGLAQWKLLFETYPATYLYHENKQFELLKKCPKIRPFLRKALSYPEYMEIKNKRPEILKFIKIDMKGITRFLWLWEYRQEILEKDQPLNNEESYDWGGCACAL